MASLHFAVLTISDSCSKGQSQDLSGPYLKDAIKKAYENSVVKYNLVADDVFDISKALKEYADTDGVNVVFTTGGTGFSPRDLTPQATKMVIDYETPNIAIAMAVKSLAVTPMAMVSRAVAGVRGKTLIINFPGSKKAAAECFDVVRSVIPHAVALINDEKKAVRATHSAMHSAVQSCGHARRKCSKVDVTRIAHRQRESTYPLLPVKDAQELIIKSMKDDSRRIAIQKPLNECLNHVLAEDATARDPLPPFPASIKDGYACICADGAGLRTVRDGISAGQVVTEALKPGECMRINTGAPLPPGADCVVQVEDTQVVQHADEGRVELSIRIMVAPKRGQDIRPTGSDISQGEIVLREGSMIGSAEIGVLATVGISNVPVFDHPTVGVLSTGNELQSPTEAVLKPGHIRDSNKSLLIALMKETGPSCLDFGVAKDEPSEMKSALVDALTKVDVLITTGSVSMGDRDMLKPILEKDFNATIHFGRVAMKPGKPTTFVTCLFEGNMKYIFCLPGNPVSAFVTCNLFVVPALRFWMGSSHYDFTRISVELEEDVTLDPRPEYARAIITRTMSGSHIPKVTLTGNQISSRLSSVTGSHLLLELPSSNDGPKELKKGASITALVIGRI